MNFFPCKDYSVEIQADKPFENDKLERASFAHFLTGLVDFYSQSGCVIALNGEWGLGKTTFIKMWNQSLVNKGYKTLYYNAWETDYFEDPIIALLGELQQAFPEHKTLKSVISKGGRIFAKVGGGILKGVVQKATNIDCDAISEGVDEAVNIFNEQLNSYEECKKDLEAFKKLLSEFVASESTEHPVVFFIDELDRCNPHYAVKTLERIKHLFEFPNIIFVLSVNIAQLHNAIQGYFGSAAIDGAEYMRRFIDLEIALPRPDFELYADFLYERFNFKELFMTFQGNNTSYSDHDGLIFQPLAKNLLSFNNDNLRFANKLYAYARLVFVGYNAGCRKADMYLLLCYLKLRLPKVYKKILLREYSIQGLFDGIENHLASSLFQSENCQKNDRHMAWAIARLLLHYNYGDGNLPLEKEFTGTPLDNKPLSTFPITTKYLSKELLDEALTHVASYSDSGYSYGLTDTLKRIELISGISFS